jgi:hypothetical protein
LTNQRQKQKISLLLVQPSANPGLTTVRHTGARSQGAMIEAEAVSDSFHKMIASESTMTEEEVSVCYQIVQALDVRWKWWFRPNRLPEHDHVRCIPHKHFPIMSN